MSDSDYSGDLEDMYKNCEIHCSHDLPDGVLVKEMLEAEGPYKPLFWKRASGGVVYELNEPATPPVQWGP